MLNLLIRIVATVFCGFLESILSVKTSLPELLFLRLLNNSIEQLWHDYETSVYIEKFPCYLFSVEISYPSLRMRKFHSHVMLLFIRKTWKFSVKLDASATVLLVVGKYLYRLMQYEL